MTFIKDLETRSKSTTHPQKKRLRSVISTSSRQPVRTPSPPSPESTLALIKDAYTSPDRLRLREALMSGGEIEFKAVEQCKTFMNRDCYSS